MVGPKFPLSLVFTAVDRITAPLNRLHSRIGRITAPLRAGTNAVRSIGEAAGMPRVAAAFGSVTSAIGGVATAAEKSFKRISILAVGAGGLAYLFKRQFIDTAAEFQNLQTSLVGIEGSAEKAQRSMAFIKDLTLRSRVFELGDIAQVFRTLRGFGMDPANGTLDAIVNQVAKLGLSGDKLTNIGLQLGQAFSKGRLMAQDANILVENGVPVWGLLERAVNRVNKGQTVTVAQLRQMSENGKLGVKAINLLIEQMGLESQGATDRMRRNWTGLIGALANKWTFFKLRVMDSGPFQRITGFLERIIDRLDLMEQSGEMQRWANRLASVLLNIFTWLETNGPRILTQIWTNLQTIWRVADQVATVFGGWGNFVTFGIAAYIAGPMVSSVFSLVAAIVALNGALLGTPAGWLLGAAGGLALLGGIVAWKSLKFPQAGSTKTDGNGIPLFNARSAAAALGGGSQLGAPVPLGLSAADQEAVRVAMANSQAGRDARVKVDVDFKNVPPGTTIRTTQSGNLPIDLSRGVTMAHAH
jgi:tape measure domain-containing protein